MNNFLTNIYSEILKFIFWITNIFIPVIFYRFLGEFFNVGDKLLLTFGISILSFILTILIFGFIFTIIRINENLDDTRLIQIRILNEIKIIKNSIEEKSVKLKKYNNTKNENKNEIKIETKSILPKLKKNYKDEEIIKKEFLGNDKVRISYKDNSIYEGEVLDNLPNGKGKIIYSSKENYVGEFKNGERDGMGKLLFSDGSYLHGYFILNEPKTVKEFDLNGKELNIYENGIEEFNIFIHRKTNF